MAVLRVLRTVISRKRSGEGARYEEKKTLNIISHVSYTSAAPINCIIVHPRKNISRLAQAAAAEAFACCRAFSGHGFLIASCILTMQPFGPLTAPVDKEFIRTMLPRSQERRWGSAQREVE